MHRGIFGSVLVGPPEGATRHRRGALGRETACDQRLRAANGVWCNWQHSGFWYRHSRFESWYPSQFGDYVGIPAWAMLAVRNCSSPRRLAA